jgi:hypothetical protein
MGRPWPELVFSGEAARGVLSRAVDRGTLRPRATSPTCNPNGSGHGPRDNHSTNGALRPSRLSLIISCPGHPTSSRQ